MCVHHPGTAGSLIQLRLSLPRTNLRNLREVAEICAKEKSTETRDGSPCSAQRDLDSPLEGAAGPPPLVPRGGWDLTSRAGLESGKGSVRAASAAASRDWEGAGAKMFLILASSCLARLHHSLLITRFLLPSTPPGRRAWRSRGMQTSLRPPQHLPPRPRTRALGSRGS